MSPAQPPAAGGALVVGAPRISVIVPVYHSEKTLEHCLETLVDLDHPSFEILVVDSSASDACREIAGRFPTVLYHHSPRRMLPHAARNLGATTARGELLVFTDPDVYVAPDWLRRLEETQRQRGGVVTAGLDCFGRRWLDRGIHWTKFSKWLPGGAPHAVDMAPTAGLLCGRTTFESAGGFRGDLMLGDAALSWELRRRGVDLWLEPRAVGVHHHVQSFADFLRERFGRGVLFSQLYLAWERPGWWRRSGRALASLLPVRLATNLAHLAGHARRAGRPADLASVLPVVVAGFVASLAGEAVGLWRSSAAPASVAEPETVAAQPGCQP